MKNKPMLNMEITGTKELFNNLDRIKKAITNELERIILSAAEIIVLDAKKRAPKKTGELSEKIEAKTLEIKEPGIKIGVGPVGKDVFYWFFVEFGTVKMEAQPFLRPAFDENKDEIIKAIQKEINHLIEKEGLK